MSLSQPFGHNAVPSAVGREDSPDPDDVPIPDVGEPGEDVPAYKSAVPLGSADTAEDAVSVGSADADEDARRAGGSR